MCQHLNLIIIPTEENSWGIADTYHVKCSDCNKILFPAQSLEKAKESLATTGTTVPLD